ncbi:MAG: response regulator [Deltaproteobacteria bacterium]|nr:response regulator [Deltaproteobacteria bacterium]
MSPTILIIDDEQIITRALSRAFLKEGFQVITASDGQDGLQKITEQNPALILLDILMPKLSGLELLEQIRQSRIMTPVILMTAYGDAKTAAKAKELGVSAYLTKPFNNIDDVISAVKKCLGS